MSALHELLQHLSNRRFDNADHHRATLALVNRLDLMQAVTVATKRTTFGDVVDGAIAPDGHFYWVESNSTSDPRSRLYTSGSAPLGRPEALEAADFISLCGFPDGKTLAFATYHRCNGGHLHFGDWTSDLIPFRCDDGAMFWQHEGQVYAAVLDWHDSTDVNMQLFVLPGRAPVRVINTPTHSHAVINGKLSWIEEIANGPRGKVETVNWGEWDSPAFPKVCKNSFSVNPSTGKPRFIIEVRSGFLLIEEGCETVPLASVPWISENRMFDDRLENIHTPGGEKPWRLVIDSMDGPTWTWVRDHVARLRMLCFLPDIDNTALLIDPNTKRHGADLEVVLVNQNGKEYANERIEGATGKMRRIGNQIAVEGKDDHGPTVSLFHPADNWSTHPLVGSFDRLTSLDDGTVAGWHYANGVISLQRYT